MSIMVEIANKPQYFSFMFEATHIYMFLTFSIRRSGTSVGPDHQQRPSEAHIKDLVSPSQLMSLCDTDTATLCVSHLGILAIKAIHLFILLKSFPFSRSQTFVSFLESCLEKDPSRRWSVEELLQHPFITELPPAKTIRAEIKEHLRAVQNRPAKQGLRAVRWAREQLRRAREHLRRAREQLGRAREQLRRATEQLRRAREHLWPRWSVRDDGHL
ncbi:hypothetical protein XENTR_v10011016 [Xenopus tropicalis]|nr:hypothetical protein XENTR_v10011016 [Xenopus tropicalis]